MSKKKKAVSDNNTIIIITAQLFKKQADYIIINLDSQAKDDIKLRPSHKRPLEREDPSLSC